MNNFIDTLSISQENKIKLASLGADNPAALLGVIYAVPEAMSEFIGYDPFNIVKKELNALLTPEQKSIFDQDLPDFKIQPFLDKKNLS